MRMKLRELLFQNGAQSMIYHIAAKLQTGPGNYRLFGIWITMFDLSNTVDKYIIKKTVDYKYLEEVQCPIIVSIQ